MNRRSIKAMAFRLKLRKSLQEQDNDLLEIAKDEVNREIDRRNKKK